MKGTWEDKAPEEILADFSFLLKEIYGTYDTQQQPEVIYIPYTQYRWLVRERIVAILSKKPRRRPAFANALLHS